MVGAQTTEADAQALLSFKAGGDTNGDLDSWDGSPCGDGWDSYDLGWRDVKCSAMNGRVTRVILREKPGLSGSVDALAPLTALTHLALNGCTGVSGSVETLCRRTHMTGLTCVVIMHNSWPASPKQPYFPCNT